jgi:hypothetical protein
MRKGIVGHTIWIFVKTNFLDVQLENRLNQAKNKNLQNEISAIRLRLVV